MLLRLETLSLLLTALFFSSSARAMENAEDILHATTPVLVLHLDEAAGNTTFEDSSGHGNTGSCTGTMCPTLGVQGKFNTGAQFNGTSNVIIMANSASINTTGGINSSVVWERTNTCATYPTFISFYNNATAGAQIDCNSAGNTMILYDGNFNTQATTGSIADNDWHMLAMTFDGTNSRAYVDGVLNSTGTLTNPNSTLGSRIGADCSESQAGPPCTPYAYYFSGIMDEVTVWNRTLSHGDMGEYFHMGVEERYSISSAVERLTYGLALMFPRSYWGFTDIHS